MFSRTSIRRPSGEGDIQWLSSSPIRQRPRRRLTGLLVLLGPLVVIAALTVLLVDFAPKQSSVARTTSPRLEQAPAGNDNFPTASTKPAGSQTAPRTILPGPNYPAGDQRPINAPRQAAEAPATSQQMATAVEGTTPSNLNRIPDAATPAAVIPAPAAPPVSVGAPMSLLPGGDSSSQTSNFQADAQASSAPAQAPVNLAGAFPTAPATGAADASDGQDFAVYLDEAAPDEAAARALLGDVQRKYGSQLAGNRLTYRRVKVGDSQMYRVRMSGLSQSRASELCEALKGAGGACEVGPR